MKFENGFPVGFPADAKVDGPAPRRNLVEVGEIRPVECPRTSKTALCTLAVGNAGDELYRHTSDSQQRYAQRHGMDYVVIGDRSQGFVLAEKLRAGSVLEQYPGGMVYVDGDVFIHRDAPNILDTVPAGKIGLCDVTGWVPKQWAIHEAYELCRSQHVDHVPMPVAESYWNSGVIVARGPQIHYFDPPDHPLNDSWCAEEALGRLRLYQFGIPVHNIGIRWNWQYYLDKGLDRLEGCYFAHIAGLKDDQAARRLILRAMKWGDSQLSLSRTNPVVVDTSKGPTVTTEGISGWREAKAKFTIRLLPEPIQTIPKRATLGSIFPQGGIGAEIGVLYGHNAVNLLESANPSKMFLVDRWRNNSYYDWIPRDDQTWDEIYEICKSQFSVITLNVPNFVVEMVEMDSLEWLRSQPDDSLDWVYLDTYHHYEQVRAEIWESARAVKSGGIIAGHDFVIAPRDASDSRFKCEVVQAVIDAVQSGIGTLIAVTDEELPSWAMRVR